MLRRTRAYLADMREAAAYIRELTDGHSEASYRTTKPLRQLVERTFEIIGEAMRRLLHHDPAIAERFPDGRKIVAFRNVIAHDYDAIDDGVDWTVATTDVPKLVAIIDAILDETASG